MYEARFQADKNDMGASAWFFPRARQLPAMVLPVRSLLPTAKESPVDVLILSCLVNSCVPANGYFVDYLLLWFD